MKSVLKESPERRAFKTDKTVFSSDQLQTTDRPHAFVGKKQSTDHGIERLSAQANSRRKTMNFENKL